jgi:hypothetical protein
VTNWVFRVGASTMFVVVNRFFIEQRYEMETFEIIMRKKYIFKRRFYYLSKRRFEKQKQRRD